MSHPRTVLIAAVVALALGAGLARAQLVITDPAVTLRDAVILVAIDVFIIWALIARGRHVQRF